MIRFSTGLRNAITLDYGLGMMMNGGVIRVYGGTMPSTPDDPPGTTELGRITTEGKVFIPGDDTVGAGLLLAFISPGTLINDGDWRLKGLASGTATWFRWCWNQSDPLLSSDYYPRMDGDVGASGALRLVSTALTASTDVLIMGFQLVLPMEG